MDTSRNTINTYFCNQTGKNLQDCIKEDAIFLGLVGRGKTTIVQEIGKIRKELTGASQSIIEASYIVEKTNDKENNLNLFKATGYHSNLVIDNLNGAGEVKHFGQAKDMIEDILKVRLDKKLEAIKVLKRAKDAGENIKDVTKYGCEKFWATSTNTIITNLTLTELKDVFSEPLWNRIAGMMSKHVYMIKRDESFRTDINYTDVINELDL